jgi:hypothetical protein
MSTGTNDFVTSNDTSVLPPGTYYLTHVDALYRRFYKKKGEEAKDAPKIANGRFTLRNFICGACKGHMVFHIAKSSMF